MDVKVVAVKDHAKKCLPHLVNLVQNLVAQVVDVKAVVQVAAAVQAAAVITDNKITEITKDTISFEKFLGFRDIFSTRFY